MRKCYFAQHWLFVWSSDSKSSTTKIPVIQSSHKKDAKFNGLIYIALLSRSSKSLLYKCNCGKFPFTVFYPLHTSAINLREKVVQLTRGTLYPLNCPDQERIKSANVHHSILANGLNEWERINAPLLLWRCSKNSQVNIVHSRYIISYFALLPIHEQIKAILVLLKTRHKRKGRDMCWGKNVVNFVQ